MEIPGDDKHVERGAEVHGTEYFGSTGPYDRRIGSGPGDADVERYRHLFFACHPFKQADRFVHCHIPLILDVKIHKRMQA
jgi:hypothetical protein